LNQLRGRGIFQEKRGTGNLDNPKWQNSGRRTEDVEATAATSDHFKTNITVESKRKGEASSVKRSPRKRDRDWKDLSELRNKTKMKRETRGGEGG